MNPIFLKSLSISMMIFAILLLQSCMPTPSNTRKALLSSSSTGKAKDDPKLPVFSEGNNFIQNGGLIYTSSVTFDVSYSDTLQLRGKDVDNYIRNNGTQTISCLTARFLSEEQINILAATPHSVYNFSTQTLEYYYSLSPADEASNKSFCQKSGLINKLFSLYPALIQTYKIGSLCPSSGCTKSNFVSSPMEMYSQSGYAITQIGTTQLSYALTNRPNIETTSGKTCVVNSECTASGYDCCSLGQCVKDLAMKPGVDKNSSNYLQALQDILNNPSHIYLYPQYYYICSNSVNSPTPTTPESNVVNEATARLKKLADLYSCTTKIEGELGICTKTISNASYNGSISYSAGADDRSFANTYTNASGSAKEDLTSIQEVSYGEVVLFSYDQITSEPLLRPDVFVASSALTINGHHNDDTSTGARVTITSKPAGAVSSDLVIKYRIDASCTQVNNALAKCEKHYVQGQKNSGDTAASNRRGRVTDHYPASNTFKLPLYANTSKLIVVEVDGIVQRQGIDWDIVAGSPPSIQFLSAGGELKVFDTQKVKITYFVDLIAHNVMESKLAALTKIKETCSCADLNCGLTPIKNTNGAITDYACVYPDPIPSAPPATQVVYLSSKTVPVRYFDTSGVSKASLTGSTLPQEGSVFSYRKDNLLNPSNMPDIVDPVSGEDTYIGFNEIYGSLSYTNNSAKPAKEVSVVKGRNYDIFVDNGTYSNCVQCGNDYYSQLSKLFPLTQFGGGATPFQSRTDRIQSNGIRADDLSFGRACLVPASMLPFSHAIASEAQEQRLNRMRAQHFLYANGYQRDWFGFDYGAVIGSFDGVRWFAIGTNRRIDATSNKLFIAVNAPFGDLALESTYTVTINDGSLNPSGASMVATDAASDGAECQKFHQCSTDNDCATTLGWDYACANVSEITTSWPKFDDNAKEIPDTQREDNRLTSILKTPSTGKRCVYRGRGSACTPNYLAVNLNSTFNQTQTSSFHTCSSNNYCQSLLTSGIPSSTFNNRISRYGKVRTDASSDSFGLAAKVPGRPMEFNAVEPIRAETLRNMNSNKIAGLCIPGRSPEADTLVNQNSIVPAPEYMGDKILGIGMSYKKGTVTPVSTYLAACSVMDSTNNYFYKKSDANTASSSNAELIRSSGSQAISTNALNSFVSIFSAKGISFPLYKNNSEILSSLTFTENRCMRAPGASCFTDLDCAPSKTIADKIKMLNSEDSVVTNILNKYEIKFWQEELVCSQATAKTDATYSSFNNRCCREVGKTISLPSKDLTNPLYMDKVPGIDILMSDKNRYSRVATVYRDQLNDASNSPRNFPVLQVAIANQCSAGGCMSKSLLTNQFKTFSAYGEKTSCSGDWIRNFDNGTHIWEKTKHQKFNPSMFRCMNWLPGFTANKPWTCEGLEDDDPDCNLVQTSPNSAKAKAVMSYLGRLELLGIPQIALESVENFTGATPGDMSCLADPLSHGNEDYPKDVNGEDHYKYPSELFATGTPAKEYSDGTKQYYSAGDITNFGASMKKVFKADEIVSCLPAGTTMAVGADANLCCTGFINGKTNKCQLQDYVDLSVYTNRYVSSEAKKLSTNLFDEYGYIKEPSYVAQLACEKSMCASGKVAFGVLISNLKKPGQTESETKLYRFLQDDSASDDANGVLGLYNLGLKLNTHAYCYPASGSTGEDLTVYSCN